MTLQDRSFDPAARTSAVIRPLTPADIDAADRVLTAAFRTVESYAPDLRRYLAIQPDGWFLATVSGEPVGTSGAMDYVQFAVIGLMTVHPDFQRRGIGQAMLAHVLSWLAARGTSAACLHAETAAVPLYTRAGFVESDRTDVFERPADMHGTDVPDRSLPDGVRTLRPDDVPALADYDATVFGAGRSAVLSALLSGHPGRAFAARDEAGHLTGYLIAQTRRLGPWIAHRPQDAEALLQAAVPLSYDRVIRVQAPRANAAAALLLERYGFRRVRSTRYMVRGTGGPPGQRACLYGLASFSLG